MPLPAKAGARAATGTAAEAGEGPGSIADQSVGATTSRRLRVAISGPVLVVATSQTRASSMVA